MHVDQTMHVIVTEAQPQTIWANYRAK